jgi:uncharacterized protein with PIN domain
MSEVIENAVILIDDDELTKYVHNCPQCNTSLGSFTLEKKRLGQMKVFRNASLCPQCGKKYFGCVEIK